MNDSALSEHLGPMPSVSAKSNSFVRSFEHILMMARRVEPPLVGGRGGCRSHVDIFTACLGAFVGSPIPGSFLPSDRGLVSEEIILGHVF